MQPGLVTKVQFHTDTFGSEITLYSVAMNGKSGKYKLAFILQEHPLHWLQGMTICTLDDFTNII